MPRTRSLALSLGLAALLSGCHSGPDFTRPALPSAGAGYAGAGAGHAVLAEGPDAQWWHAFGSAELDALVARAMAGNQSLAAANATLGRAQAQLAAVAGRGLPQVDATVRGEREEMNLAAFGFNPSSLGGVSIANPTFNLYSVGGGISYNLDLWGRQHRATEEAAANAEAELHQAEAAHLVIAGRVVSEYLAIAAIRDRIATQTALIEESRRNVALTEAREQAGAGTRVDVLAARAQLAADQGEMPVLAQYLAEARDMLAVLLGISPAELGATDYSLDGLKLPETVPVALPSTLVRKRPDILTAEARLHAATAGVGVATASLYPDLTLGATYTQAANSIDRQFSPAFRAWDIFGQASAPIFHGGSLKAGKRAAEAEARAVAASYRQTVLEAFGQVSDLLAALDNDDHGLASARESAQIADQSLDLSRKSFEVGNSGILQVLDASRANQHARMALLEARARRYHDVARLYVATAGGWTEK